MSYYLLNITVFALKEFLFRGLKLRTRQSRLYLHDGALIMPSFKFLEVFCPNYFWVVDLSSSFFFLLCVCKMLSKQGGEKPWRNVSTFNGG